MNNQLGTDGFTVEERNGINCVIDIATDKTIRILPEKEINNMSERSLNAYRKKVNAWRKLASPTGDFRAWNSLYYLYKAIQRTRRERS